MAKLETEFWTKVLGKGWEKRCPIVVRGRVFVRFNRVISLQEAEDLFQQALLRILTKVSPAELESKEPNEIAKMIFGGYLPNIIREWLRDIRGEQPTASIDDEDQYTLLPNVNIDQSERVYSEAWKSFSVDESEVFRRYFIEGEKQAAIAESMQRSIGSINKLVQSSQHLFVEILAAINGEKI